MKHLVAVIAIASAGMVSLGFSVASPKLAAFQRTSEDVFLVEHGSLYPALHRLEKSGCIASKWEMTDRGREMRMYRLTAKGRKQLSVEESKWRELVRAMARMLRPA